MSLWRPGDLNEEQEAAVAEESSVFLVACPGSGKTRTLTYKLASRLTKLTSPRQRVAAITYTHRAADEIRERIEALGVDPAQLWIGTIHAFCLEWILRPYRIYHPELRRGFRIIGSHDRELLLTELCEPYRHQRPRVTHWDCDYYCTPSGRVVTGRPALRETVGRILDHYADRLRETRQIDFELILKFAHEVLAANPPVARLLSGIFDYILVDEYQDTKQIQYSIVAAILRAGAGRTRTFIVGDPNQAIYRTLGGHAISATEFRAMAGVPLKEMALSLNYRSTARVVDYFGNFRAHPTTISAASAHKHESGIISFDTDTSHEDLEAEIARLIRHNVEELGVSPREVCVAAPQWVHLASMTRRLVAALPEYRFDGPGMVPFARDQDNCWYKLSKLALTRASPDVYFRRLHWAAEVLDDLEQAGADVSDLSPRILLRECNAIRPDIQEGLPYLAAMFETLFQRIGIDYRAIASLMTQHTTFFESAEARIRHLQQDGADFTAVAAFRNVFESRTGVTVSTIHGIKGTEFDAVIVYGLLEGMVPHFSDDNGRDSAKKLLYVVCSRSKKHLHLIAERDRYNGRNELYRTTEILEACQFGYDRVPGRE